MIQAIPIHRNPLTPNRPGRSIPMTTNTNPFMDWRLNFHTLICFIAFFISAPSIHAQESSTKTSAKPYIFGAKHCTGCHDQPSKKNDNCRMTEWLTWNNLDKHRIAFDWFDDDKKKTPSGIRAQTISENLGITNLHQAKQCLGCHSLPVESNIPTSYFDNELQRAREGVTCVACHGASKEWVIEHVAASDPSWKNTSGPQRWEKFGMVDLKNPVTQARQCVSCHVGDPDQKLGRKISHEMYAAGHPPLPGLEVSSYIAEQPRHWLTSTEKPDSAHGTARPVDLLAVSGLVTLRTELALIRDYISNHANTNQSQDGGPELSLFDCAACHHDITKNKSKWRQSQRVAGAPGRPRLPQWPRTLVRFSLILADPLNWKTSENQITDLLLRVDQELSKSPYGIESTDISKTLQEAIEQLDRVLGLLDERWNKTGKLTNDNSLQSLRIFLDSLLDHQPIASFDYDTARQIGWAIRTSISNGNKPIAPGMIPDLEELDLLLGLKLRPNHSPTDSPPAKSEQTSVTELLKDRLKLANAYEPLQFRKVLERIRYTIK